MKVVIFGGTTEGRELSALLQQAGAEVTVCVASEYGEEEQGRVAGVQTRVGPLSGEEKQALLEKAAICVDATHPYATHVTASVKEACGRAGVEHLRLLRDPGERPPAGGRNTVMFSGAGEAAGWLREREGNILLTTGARELPAFAGLPPGRIYPRVLPSHESLKACEDCGIPHRNIIAMQGPFTRELNTALIRQFEIRFVVTKDGGGPGGFREKAEAAEETGTWLLVLRRPEEQGLSFRNVLDRCMLRLGGEK